jgi:predicted Fe-Mo cluster-binding NifX family protein
MNMKIAITSIGKEPTSRIDPRFGRAKYIVIYDTEEDALELVDNSGADQLAHGAGIQTAQAVLDKGAEAVVSGRFGPKATQVLAAAKIKMIMRSDGTVAEAIELAKRNELIPVDNEA